MAITHRQSEVRDIAREGELAPVELDRRRKVSLNEEGGAGAAALAGGFELPGGERGRAASLTRAEGREALRRRLNPAGRTCCNEGMSDVLRTEIHGSAALVTLDVPERRNVLSVALVDAIAGAFDALEANPDVRSVVLTGAGKAFCAGAERSEERRVGKECVP